jgi:CO/xanthine dehydrogenase Mo-binding subunit
MEVTWGDTNETAWDMVTDASRSLHCNGKAFYNAAQDLLRQLRQAAGRDAVAPRDYRSIAQRVAQRADFTPYFDAANDVNPYLDEGTGKIVQHPPMVVEADTARRARELVARGMVVGLGRYVWNPGAQSWGASAAEVEVDMLTGQVKVLRIAAAHDCGRVIYRRGAIASVMGGTIMGLGHAMTEELVCDPVNHYPVNATVHELRPPTILDYPEILPLLVETPNAIGPFGAKGLAENTIYNAAAAIGNAIFNATGIRVRELPFTWERVHDALHAGKA